MLLGLRCPPFQRRTARPPPRIQPVHATFPLPADSQPGARPQECEAEDKVMHAQQIVDKPGLWRVGQDAPATGNNPDRSHPVARVVPVLTLIQQFAYTRLEFRRRTNCKNFLRRRLTGQQIDDGALICNNNRLFRRESRKPCSNASVTASGSAALDATESQTQS